MTADPDLVPDDTEPLEINAEIFPDEAFREMIADTADTDHDGSLSASERNSTLILLCNGNEKIADVQGTEYFPQLQGIDISGTSVIEIDTSENHLLQYINISNTGINSLDLRSNTDLSEIIADGCNDLEELLLPEPSSVSSISLNQSALSCEADSEGHYTACHIN